LPLKEARDYRNESRYFLPGLSTGIELTSDKKGFIIPKPTSGEIYIYYPKNNNK
jgi:hypothetical protein